MKDREYEEPIEYPETPPWTMFFDGPLYQKYDEFMKTKDFSKILLATKLRLANSPEPEVKSATSDDTQWDKQMETDPGSTYQYVPEDYYRKMREDEKRRTRRTRAFILLGIFIMAAIATATALVIHYVYIPTLEDGNPPNNVNVSFSGNATSEDISGAETTTPLDLTNLLSPDVHHPHKHDHPHDHGILFEDLFVNTTDQPALRTARTDTTSAVQTTSDMSSVTNNSVTLEGDVTSASASVETSHNAVYDLHVKPKTGHGDNVSTTSRMREKSTGTKPGEAAKPYVSTIQIDPMDFFAMELLFTTTSSLPAVAKQLKTSTTKKSSASAVVNDTTPLKDDVGLSKQAATVMEATVSKADKSVTTDVLKSDSVNSTTTTTTTTTADPFQDKTNTDLAMPGASK